MLSKNNKIKKKWKTEELIAGYQEAECPRNTLFPLRKDRNLRLLFSVKVVIMIAGRSASSSESIFSK